MIIKPVYLLEPEEEKPIGFSRRAFITAVAFASAAGFGLGVACISLAGEAEQEDSEGPVGDERGPESEGLRRARVIADGPEEELSTHWVGFMSAANRWPEDETLSRGVDRLTTIVLNRDVVVKNRAAAAKVILNHARRFRSAELTSQSALEELVR